jgi:cation diffusion facilitator family transporter
MHTEDLSRWTHEHRFDSGNAAAERSTRVVMWITAAMMVVEIVAGWWFNSMALLADGWHMSSHAVAIGLSAAAYALARRHAQDPRFAFGTWKIEILGGFASAIFLLGVAALMVVGSVERILSPAPIHYQEAIVVAVLGLVVNIVCALILGQAHHHGHDHGHGHGHGHHHGHGRHGHDDHGHHDLNLKSAYVHVIADAATSVLAIAALVGGWLWGWSWLDPLMGLVGAVLVGVGQGPGGGHRQGAAGPGDGPPGGRGDPRGGGGRCRHRRQPPGRPACLARRPGRLCLRPDGGDARPQLTPTSCASACRCTRRWCTAPSRSTTARPIPETGGSIGRCSAARASKPLICQAILILMSRAPQSASAQVLPLPGDKPAMPLPSSPATPPGGSLTSPCRPPWGAWACAVPADC